MDRVTGLERGEGGGGAQRKEEAPSSKPRRDGGVSMRPFAAWDWWVRYQTRDQIDPNISSHRRCQMNPILFYIIDFSNSVILNPFVS